MQQLTENEVWKDIPNYEGLYQCSNLGNFKSIGRKRIIGHHTFDVKDIFMKTHINKKGYSAICLYTNKKHKIYRAHQLIAFTFLNHKRCGNDYVVNHINGIKTDNRVCNLEVVTNRENSSTCKRVYSDIKKLVGVIYKENRFCAKLSINTKEVFLGSFHKEETASLAYQTAVKHIDKYNGNPADFRAYIKSLIYNDSN